MRKGQEMPLEIRLKVSANRKGKCIGNRNGFKKGQISAWKGRSASAETRHKQRLAKLGKPSPNKGKETPSQVRMKISLSLRQRFFNLDPSYDYRLDARTRRGGKRIRRERMREFGGSHTTEEWEVLKKEYGWKCPVCHKTEPNIKLTRDHIIAISKGGSDDIENIQPLCNPCNAKKGTKNIRY